MEIREFQRTSTYFRPLLFSFICDLYMSPQKSQVHKYYSGVTYFATLRERCHWHGGF